MHVKFVTGSGKMYQLQLAIRMVATLNFTILYIFRSINCDLILENRLSCHIGISRNTDFKYSSHCGSPVLDCSHAKYTV